MLRECVLSLAAEDLRAVLSPEEFDRYLTSTFDEMVDRDPAFIRCPVATCRPPSQTSR